MNNDWKEALSALRNNMPQPQKEEEETSEIFIEEVKSKYLQPDPLSIVIDRKGRNGKTATIIEGFTIQPQEVEEIARKLKQKLGVGGSVREGEILVQGDHKEAVKNFLSQTGFKIR